MKERALLWAVGAVLLAFVLTPLVALVATAPGEPLARGLASNVLGPALRVSLSTSVVSLALVTALGTPLAFALATSGARAARVVEALVQLLAVVPPAVAGLALLLAFGRQGLLGGALAALGVEVAFTWWAVVLAQIFVATPLYVQAAVSAFRRVDARLVLVARTLGSGPLDVLRRVALPLAWPGLAAGALLGWARALGEFGATLFFAGNLPGRTQTLPLAVYAALEEDTATAQALAVLLLGLAGTVLLLAAVAFSRGPAVESSREEASLPAHRVQEAEPSGRSQATSLTVARRPGGEALTVRVRARRGALRLDVQLDEVPGPLVVVGPNGAGKTSLALALLGVTEADEVALTFGARKVVDAAAGLEPPPELRRLGYVPQGLGLFPHLSVRDNVRFGSALSPPRLEALCAELGLASHLARMPHQLSGGEQQRVALARALAVEPCGLVLDEPLAALDITARAEVLTSLGALLRRLALPTVLITHDAEDARALGGTVAVLEAGRVVQWGPWEALEACPATPFVRALVGGLPSAPDGQDV